MFFIAFLGKARFSHTVEKSNGNLLKIALITLAVLSIIGGFMAPELTQVFTSNLYSENIAEPHWLHTVAIATPFVGIGFSWFYFKSYRGNDEKIFTDAQKHSSQNPVASFCLSGLGFDRLYSLLLIKPFVFIARLNRRDVIDQILMSFTWYVGLWRDVLVFSQNGYIRWYAAAFALGLVFFIGGWLL